MDSTQKMNDLLKKKRPVPRKFNTFKDFDASLFKGAGSNIHNVPDLSTYIHKFSQAKTPERIRANPSLNYSHIPEIRPLGKENRSSSVSRKEERSASVKRNMRDRSHNYSLLNDRSLAVDMQEVEQKRAELAGRLQVYLSSDRKSSSHKRNLSSKRTGNVAPPPNQYKRLNSSFVETRQRALSQDKRPVHFHKNSSLLNNSMMFDEPGNISRDQSYLKELLDEDTSHVHDISGVNYQYSMSPNKNDETYDDHQATVSITNQDKIHAYEDSIEMNDKKNRSAPDRNTPLYDKGKQLFREKKYEEGIKYLRDSLESEERTTEALYLLGVSYLWLGQYANAIKEFKALLEIQPSCHKNVYVLLSIAYKKSNDLPSAIKTLTKAIMKHPKYYDAYIFKGKLLLKEKQWERALADFAIATKLKPHKNLALIGQGDAFRMLYEYDKAIDCYTQAIDRSPSALSTALLKRAIVLIEIKKLDEALKDLEKTIKMDPSHSEAYYFKGFVLEKKRDFNEAILCFEQAIKHKSSRKAVMKSLYEIARIKIEQRNFYEAYHTLQRATLLELEEKAFSKLKLFTEGVIHLMKRKFEEGVTNLTDVIKKQDVGDHFLPMAFNYRAYGHFCCGKTKEALEDYKELQKLTKLDQGSTYNKLLCEAILAAEADSTDQASKKFAQAQKIFPNKMEPNFYRAVLTINTFYKAHPKPEAEEFNTGIDSAIQDFEKCLELNDNCSNLFYVRALVFYALGKFSLAHQNIEKAIEKADENYAKYYHLRGAIFACTQSYYNAVSDLSIAINLDKDFQPAYLERAKCYFTLGDLKQAFMDIQDYITVKSDDSNIHLWAGNLLFCTGAYEDAVKAYSNSETLKDSENLLALRVKCNIVLKELNLALTDLERLLELKTANNIFYYVDRECLVALKAGTASLEDVLEKEGLSKAIQKITKVLSYKVSGNIFGLHDLYFYKSVFQFYLGDVQSALDDLDKSWEVRETPVIKTEKDKEQRAGTEAETKEMMKLLEDVYSSTGSDEIKEENTKPGAIDYKEYLYNKAIFLLVLKRFEDSLDVILQLRTMVPPEVALEFDIFVKLINEQLQASEDDAPVSAKEEEEEPQEIVIFQYVNRLCSIFPPINLPFNSKTQYTTRLTFCLPPVEPPSLIPTANYNVLSEIKVTTVENKPEAPWIRRTFGGVIFTENFMEKEEREIDDLQEVIQRNGLKEEEIYKSLANSHRTGGTHESNNALNQAVIMEQEASNKHNNAVYIAEDIFPGNVGKGRMIKSRTGGV